MDESLRVQVEITFIIDYFLSYPHAVTIFIVMKIPIIDQAIISIRIILQ